jgi:Putative Flp pilus-assembly TadE/G-like
LLGFTFVTLFQGRFYDSFVNSLMDQIPTKQPHFKRHAMTKTSRFRLRQFVPVFLDNQQGGIALIAALLLPVFVTAGGVAVDYGRAASAKSKLQAALDIAVLAGASYTGDPVALSGTVGGPSNEKKIAAAQKSFDARQAQHPLPVSTVSFSFEDGKLSGTAAASVETTLTRLFGIDAIAVTGASAAGSGFVREPACFLAMHPTRKHTLELNDSVSVIAPDCNIYGNSNNVDDVVDPHTEYNFLVGRSVQAIGFGHHYIPNVSPPLEHAPEYITDPLVNLSIPSAGTCTSTKLQIVGGSQTLNPGTYCGGISISGNATVTLNPGLYIIAGGNFAVSSATIVGTDVTIALADTSVGIDWNAGVVQLAAPKIGTYAGMAIIGTRDPKSHSIRNTTVDVHGVIYLLQGDFAWSNTGTPAITAKWTAWIVDGVSWTGDGTIRINFDLASSDIPYPGSLRVIPRSNTARLLN